MLIKQLSELLISFTITLKFTKSIHQLIKCLQVFYTNLELTRPAPGTIGKGRVPVNL